MTRKLAQGQTCQVWIYDTRNRANRLIFETTDILLEAPNWAADGLILNGNGVLWRMPVDAPTLHEIRIDGVPPLNNDHVLDPDGVHIFVSANDDFHIYRAPLAGGAAVRVTPDDGVLHFLHGVSPDGTQLAYVGLRADLSGGGFRPLGAEICTIGTDGQGVRTLTENAVADGPEYSPDGAWIYFNAELFSGHAQICRMRTDGSGLERLTQSASVDWFPHLAPQGGLAVYLAYPAGTKGHPADLPVELRLVTDDWHKAETVARIDGGQGTINVNSWSPDGHQFAYVAYPFKGN